jgi:hypothetical protein
MFAGKKKRIKHKQTLIGILAYSHIITLGMQRMQLFGSLFADRRQIITP